MTDQEENKLIDAYMPGSPSLLSWFDNSDWNSVMIVVEAIFLDRTVSDITISPGRTIIKLKNGKVFASPVRLRYTSIEECRLAIVEFIQYRNSIKKHCVNKNNI